MKEDLSKEVTKKLNLVLHSFQKEKSQGPDGFTLEFFLGFYDLTRIDLLKVVKESQRSGKILGALNSTFITLIPKKQKVETFNNFTPIACCTLVYKVIAKIIARG